MNRKSHHNLSPCQKNLKSLLQSTVDLCSSSSFKVASAGYPGFLHLNTRLSSPRRPDRMQPVCSLYTPSDFAFCLWPRISEQCGTSKKASAEVWACVWRACYRRRERATSLMRPVSKMCRDSLRQERARAGGGACTWGLTEGAAQKDVPKTKHSAQGAEYSTGLLYFIWNMKMTSICLL